MAAVALAVVANVGLFLVAFRVLTAPEVPTRHLRLGAILAGIGWEVVQLLGTYFVTHSLKGTREAYGVFGLVLGLIAWIYVLALVTVLAAEINVVGATEDVAPLAAHPLHRPGRAHPGRRARVHLLRGGRAPQGLRGRRRRLRAPATRRFQRASRRLAAMAPTSSPAPALRPRPDAPAAVAWARNSEGSVSSTSSTRGAPRVLHEVDARVEEGAEARREGCRRPRRPPRARPRWARGRDVLGGDRPRRRRRGRAGGRRGAGARPCGSRGVLAAQAEQRGLAANVDRGPVRLDHGGPSASWSSVRCPWARVAAAPGTRAVSREPAETDGLTTSSPCGRSGVRRRRKVDGTTGHPACTRSSR